MNHDERDETSSHYEPTEEDHARWQRDIDALPAGLKNHNTLGADTPEETRRRARLFPGAVKVRTLPD